MEAGADGRSRACPDGGADPVSVPRASVPPPNPQSPFDGLRAGFVNASSGNLTFRRRDIVARAQGPVAFARVHDSRIAANADFGPGWRLSLAEEPLADGDAVTHVDGSGARQGFAWGAAGHAASPPTPRREGTRLTFEDVGGARVATLVDGEATRTFERAGGTGTRWAVRTVATRARTLEFAWEGGRLASVSHGGATLFEIDRDADGRIARVRDGHGRSVSYAYDADGRLETVRDLAGSDWNHRYRDDGLLVAAVDPEGRTCLAVEHDDAGRVARASADGRVHACAYGPDATAVTEGTGERHTLLRGASGVTVGVSSTTGASWTATLDASNRVSTLALPGRAVAYAYDGEGRVETVAETTPDGTTTTRSFEHDGRGRLVSATGGPDPVTVTYAGNGVHVLTGSEAFEHETDDRGRVVSVRRGGEPEIRVGRDRAGNVVEISQGHRNARFGRDELGRIADAAFADGSSVRHSHDELGNLRLAERGDGSSVAYEHDAAGTMAAMEETGREGTVRRWAKGPDAAGRTVRDWPAMLDPAPGPAAWVDRGGGDGATPMRRSGIGDLPAGGSPWGAWATALNGDPSPRSPEHPAAAALATRGLVGSRPEMHVPHLREARAVADAAAGLLGSAPAALGLDEAHAFMELARPLLEQSRNQPAHPGHFPPELRRSDQVSVLASPRAPGESCTCNPEPPREYGPILAGPVTSAMLRTGIWGIAFGRLDTDSLACEETCANEEYRIVGEVRFIENEGHYRPDVWAAGTCGAGKRTAANIARTVEHERHHLRRKASTVNLLQNVRRSYDNIDACEAGLMIFRKALGRDYSRMEEDQRCHRDDYFRTTFVHAAECRPPATASVEVATTRTHYGICADP